MQDSLLAGLVCFVLEYLSNRFYTSKFLGLFVVLYSSTGRVFEEICFFPFFYLYTTPLPRPLPTPLFISL